MTKMVKVVYYCMRCTNPYDRVLPIEKDLYPWIDGLCEKCIEGDELNEKIDYI